MEMEQKNVYEVAQVAAQRFMNGEIYYQDAIDSVVDTFSPEYVMENYWAAQAAAEDLIDEQLLELERAAIDEAEIYRAAEEAAQSLMGDKIDYDTAVFRVQCALGPTYVKRNPKSSHVTARDLLDEQLLKLEEAALDESKIYDVAEEAAQDFMDGKTDYHEAAFRVISTFPPTYVRRNPNAARIAAQGILDKALNMIKTSSG